MGKSDRKQIYDPCGMELGLLGSESFTISTYKRLMLDRIKCLEEVYSEFSKSNETNDKDSINRLESLVGYYKDEITYLDNALAKISKNASLSDLDKKHISLIGQMTKVCMELIKNEGCSSYLSEMKETAKKLDQEFSDLKQKI